MDTTIVGPYGGRWCEDRDDDDDEKDNMRSRTGVNGREIDEDDRVGRFVPSTT